MARLTPTMRKGRIVLSDGDLEFDGLTADQAEKLSKELVGQARALRKSFRQKRKTRRRFVKGTVRA